MSQTFFFFLTWIFSSFTFGKLCYCHQNRVLYQHLFFTFASRFFPTSASYIALYVSNGKEQTFSHHVMRKTFCIMGPQIKTYQIFISLSREEKALSAFSQTDHWKKSFRTKMIIFFSSKSITDHIFQFFQQALVASLLPT